MAMVFLGDIGDDDLGGELGDRLRLFLRLFFGLLCHKSASA
jgi:hypothetical protein